MQALFSSFTSCSGDEHEFIVAIFTTQEKAETVLKKVKEHFPTERFYITEYIPPKIDPTFEDLIWEGITPVKTPDNIEHDPEWQRLKNILEEIS